MVDLVIYHGSCRDGFTAAWVARRRYPDAEFHAGYFGRRPPPVSGRHVLIVDFSYPRLVLEGMAGQAESILLLDHHKTAQADLGGLPYAYFDMDRSGAGLAWDHLFPGEPRPWLVDYVEDRDLWRFRLPDSRAVNAYLSVLPFEFEAWTRANELGYERARPLGGVLLAKVEQYASEVRRNARMITLDGHRVPAVNASPVDTSELLEGLAVGHPFALSWSVRFDGVFQYSLRSTEEGVDVSEIAKAHGGGGHEHAAGFESRAPIEGLFARPPHSEPMHDV
jgi:oligoribonuclease NrnB/cAMP/cGMP phosphodiesterase (DHH superfamily)